MSNNARITTKMTATERQAKIYQLEECERHFARTSEQIILLNESIRTLMLRYESAKAEFFRSFRYRLRIRLAVFEGVRSVFYEYCRDIAEDVADLRRELYGQNVEIIADTDTEDNDDDMYDDLSLSYSEYDDDDDEEEEESQDDESDAYYDYGDDYDETTGDEDAD